MGLRRRHAALCDAAQLSSFAAIPSEQRMARGARRPLSSSSVQSSVGDDLARHPKKQFGLGLQTSGGLKEQECFTHGCHIVDAEDLGASPGKRERRSKRSGRAIGFAVAQHFAYESFA